MVINIASTGRFHLCNLAVELGKMGHEVRFYSYVPTKRLEKFGLKKECSYSLFWVMLPVLICIKISKRAHWAVRLEWFFMDHFVGLFMKRSDVFIAMSTIFLYSFKKAKRKFKAITFLERGSVHALDIKELYDANNMDRNGKSASYYALTSDYAISRELTSYEIVDYISIASTSVRDSFLRYHTDFNKLFINPYGENLDLFYPTPLDKSDTYDIVMVGNWSWMKGCDLIIDACIKMDLRLLHIGSSSMDFPREGRFKNIGVVDNPKVIDYLKKSKILVLASRQEGLAMVQIQALAAGLPIVCSKFTGGETIKELINEKEAIQVFDPYNVESLCSAINCALDYADRQNGIRIIDPKISEIFSRASYAARYGRFINDVIRRM